MNIVNYSPSRWWQWILITMIASMGISASAFFFLVKLPHSASCSSTVTENDAAELIYCATTSVDEQDAQKLVAAINLVNGIPKNHPLRENSDRLIAKWLNALLRVSEKSVQTGNYSETIDTLAELPEDIPDFTTVREQIQRWENIWKQGEEIYTQAQNTIDPQERETWYKALQQAKKLQQLDNAYWSNHKYYELIQHIQALREKAEKSEQEEKIAKQEQQQAQTQDQNLEKLGLFDATQVREDVAVLQKARNLAKSGRIDDMRAAISEASLVISDAHYQDAQQLIASWEAKIELAEDQLYLANARKTAKNGDVVSLQSAINEASLVRKDRPLYKQAHQQIQQWQQQVSKLNQTQTQISLSSTNHLDKPKKSHPNPVPKISSRQGISQNETTPIPVFSPSRDISTATLKPHFQDIEVKKLELELINQESVSPSSN